jgi:hypothetical protein
VQQRAAYCKNQKRYEKRRAFFHNNLVKKLRLNRADTQGEIVQPVADGHVRNSARRMSSVLTESHVQFVSRVRGIKL